MKPKAKSHVHYAPTEEGVYVRTWTNEFVIKGNSLTQWLDQLLPYLNGERTLDELVAPLSEEQAVFVRALVEELCKRGAVFDLEGVAPVELSDMTERLYRQTILFLEDRFVDGRQRFVSLRQTPLAVAGAGLSFRACVRSLVRMGIRELHLFTCGVDEVLHTFLAHWQARDSEFQVHVQEAGTAELRMPIVFVHDEGWEASKWEEMANHADVPFLAATILGGIGVVGPARQADSTASWSSVLDRFAGRNAPHEDASPVHRMMVGNVAAMEVLRARTGLQKEHVGDQVVLIEPASLAVTRHTLWPSPLQTVSCQESLRQERFAQFASRQEEIPQVEFLATLERQVDERLGVLAYLHPGDVWQIPLALAKAVVHVPTSEGVRPLTVLRGGEDLNEALEAAARSALLVYAKCLEDEFSEPRAEEGVWAQGRTYDEWRGRGMLAACIERAREQGIAWMPLLPPDQRVAEEAGLFKILTVRYGLTAELYAQVLPAFAHAVCLVHNGSLLSQGQGRTQREALREALIGALSRLQAEEPLTEGTANGSEAFAGTAICREGVPLEIVDAQRPTWSEWLLQAVAWAEESGLQVILSPWIRDAAVYELGVLVGRVALTERGRGG